MAIKRGLVESFGALIIIISVVALLSDFSKETFFSDNFRAVGGLAVYSEIVPGDVNLDSLIDMQDSILIGQFLEGKAGLNSEQLVIADVNYDGSVDYLDRKIIADYALGKIGRIPVIYGDLNSDGVVDNNDLLIIQSYVEGFTQFTMDQAYLGDVNLDNSINEEDTKIIFSHINYNVLLPLR